VAAQALSVTVLGCSGTYAAPGGACSGYLVEGAGVRLLVDLGPGVIANLQQHIALGEVDAVFVSHEHPDHVGEAGVLQNAWRYALRREGLPVFGPAGALAKAEAASSHGTVAPTFDWTVIADGAAFTVGPLRCSVSRTDHPVETLALRVEHPDGTSLAYSADTGPGWSFAEFGAPVDLAVCEATFLAEREPERIAHLSCRQAGAMARTAGVGRLVTTHHWPGADLAAHRAEVETAFGAGVELAAIGDRYVIRR
jgi:ribonuclease BN (tRNA processing enzyme)